MKAKDKPKQVSPDAADPKPEDATAAKKGEGPRHSVLPMRWFVVIMSAGLIATTFLGIYMSFSYGGNPRFAAGALIAGTFLPIAFLLF